MSWRQVKTWFVRQTLLKIGVLQLRAAVILLFGIFGFGGFLVYVDQEITERALKKELFDRTIAVSRVIGAMTEQKLGIGQLTEVDEVFRATLLQIARSTNIAHAVIHDAQQGMSLEIEPERTYFLENDIWPCVEEVLETGQFTSRTQNDQMAVAVPLRVDGKLRGAVSVIQNKDFFAYKRGEAVMRASIIIGSFSALFVPCMLFFLNRLLKPVHALTRAVRRMSNDHLPDIAGIAARRDDIGRLSRAFVTMSKQIKADAIKQKRLANVDPVTGLANRTRFEAIGQMIAGHTTSMQGWAYFFIDLDKFKRVNDTLGHEYGDRVLTEVARRLEAACEDQGYRPVAALDEDDAIAGNEPLAYIARFGGDEFVLAARQAGQGEAAPAELGQALVAAIRRPMMVETHLMDIDASIGAALMPEHTSDPALLLRYADLAMYAIKSQGGGTCRFYTRDLSEKALDTMLVEMDLHRALGEDEIIAFYMPKIRFSDGRISGFEALARWRHIDKGLIPPDRFVPIAEATGLITDIDRAVMRHAVRQAAIWWRQGLDLPIAVNVAPAHVERADFADYIEALIAEAGIPGGLIELEFTETSAMTNTSDIVEKVKRLKKIGVRFAIDDFGTGYSNLAQLRRMPVDVLKIDRSLVRNIESDPEANLVLQTIVAMTQQMKLDIVVEGVETADQADILKALGCTYAQGYLYGAPKSLADTAGLVAPLLASKPALITALSA